MPHSPKDSVYLCILWLKGCDVHKAKSATDCLEQIKNLDSKVDVVFGDSPRQRLDVDYEY